MMTKRFISSEIRTGLAEILQLDGFVAQKERLIRNHKVGFDAIDYRVVDYNPIFQIELSLLIRIEVVEQAVNKFLPEEIINSKYKAKTITIACSYEQLSETGQSYVEISDESKLKSEIDHLGSIIRTKGLTFFEKYRELEEANKLKKNRILKSQDGINYILTNLMQSLALMRFANDPDFNELSERYRRLYVPWVGQEEIGRTALNDLIEYLKKI
jgi:hypothetical protein